MDATSSDVPEINSSNPAVLLCKTVGCVICLLVITLRPASSVVAMVTSANSVRWSYTFVGTLREVSGKFLTPDKGV